jgi:hypothetical protein
VTNQVDHRPDPALPVARGGRRERFRWRGRRGQGRWSLTVLTCLCLGLWVFSLRHYVLAGWSGHGQVMVIGGMARWTSSPQLFTRAVSIGPASWRTRWWFTWSRDRSIPTVTGLGRLQVEVPLWAPVVVSGGPTLALWGRWLRRKRGGCCLVCGYDLAGLPEGGVCPECGQRRPRGREP